MRYLWRADMNDGPAIEQLKISRARKYDLKDFPNHNLFVLRFEKRSRVSTCFTAKPYEDKYGGRCEITYLET